MQDDSSAEDEKTDPGEWKNVKLRNNFETKKKKMMGDTWKVNS